MGDRGAENGREGAEVVSLAEIARDPRFPVVGELEAYWNALRGDRPLPARSEVDPRRIEDALEYAFILERIAPGMGRFRLAGMHLNDLMGMEVRGMPLTSFFVPEARKQVAAALEHVFDGPAIVRMALTAETGIGRPGLEARLLLLPLKSDFGDVSRVLGCLPTLGPVGRAPRRFSVAEGESTCLAQQRGSGERRRSAWPAPRSARGKEGQPAAGTMAGAPRSGPRPGFFEPAPPFDRARAAAQAPRPPRAGGRPGLYLVKTDTEAGEPSP